MEILSPAGSPEAVRAAVCAGANAIYLGYGAFNARRNARNFTEEEVAEAVSYCHLRGVKVYVTLNTLVGDREMAAAAEHAVHASRIGVDAVLVQDLGVTRMLRQVAPDLPVHSSTQMSIALACSMIREQLHSRGYRSPAPAITAAALAKAAHQGSFAVTAYPLGSGRMALYTERIS